MKFEKIYNHSLVNEFLVRNFSSPTHWPEWNLLISDFFKSDFFYYGLFNKGKLSGIFPAHEIKKGTTKIIYSGQFQFLPYGGWIFSDYQVSDLQCKSIPLISKLECFSLPLLKEFGAEYHRITKSFSTLIIDLRKDEDEIWSESINSKRRNMIRKAHNLGLSVTKSISNIQDFYSIYSESNLQTGRQFLPLDFFKRLIDEQSHFKFVPMIAFKDRIPVGILGLIYDKDYSIYWLGATKKGIGSFGQSELLQWEAIIHSKENGCRYYDLCYIDKVGLPNIYKFKNGFSNNEIQVSFTSNKQLLFRLLNKIRIKK